MSIKLALVNSVRSLRHNANEFTSNIGEMGRVLGGLYEYRQKGDVSSDTRRSLLNLHCRTNGRFTEKLATLVRFMRCPRPPAPVHGFLGDLSVNQQKGIVGAIERDGYYVFEKRVPEALCDEIAEFAKKTPAMVEGKGRELKDRVVFDPQNPISKTYRFPESELLAVRPMQLLMGDESFLAIAESYMNTLPILSMLNLWWSPTFGNTPGSDAAQEFHFDFDPPPIWLLFFVYLTDVGPENGPHVYVRGSHMAGHPAGAELLSRGYVRISDADIAKAYGRENMVELCGRKGTVLAVDTRGFHKGKMLTSGHRLIAQLTFSCPPYSGAHGRSKVLPADADPVIKAAIAKEPRVFERYR